MAQEVKLKRSAVAGKVPTTGDLELGELALNTYDGRVFFEKNGSSGESVEQIFTTNAEITGSLILYKSGSTVVDIQGSQGQLFSITDSLSGSLFSVNDISGLPILEVFSNDCVVMGTFGSNALVVSGSTVSAACTIQATSSYANNADCLDGCQATDFYLASNPSGYTTCTGTVTSVGTTGTVNGITLTGTVTTSGNLTLGGTLGNITVSQLAAAAVQTSGESFSDSDSILMTAAAVNDRIQSFGYTTCTGDITGVTAGTGLSGGGTSGGVTLAVDLSELTDMTAAMVGTDEFIVLDASADRRKAANEIGLSIFNNDSGFTTCTGTVTSVATSGNVNGITLTGTVTTSGTLTLGGTLGNITVSQLAAAAVQTSGEGFSDSDTVLMTAAAVNDRIESFGYTTCTGDITGVTAGVGLSGGGTSGGVTLAVDLSELTDMTSAMVGTDEFIVLDASADRRKAANEIGLSIFNNDSGFTTCTGTVTSVGTTGTVNGITLTGTVTTSGTLTLGGSLSGITVSQLAAAAIQTSGEGFSDSDTVLMTAAAIDDRITGYGYTTCTGTVTSVTVSAGTGLCSGGTVTTSGTITLNVDLSELTDMTATMTGTDEFIVLDAGADRRKAANEIGLSIFNNDSGFTTCTGDITGVTAGVGLSGGGTSGTVALALDFSELTDMTGDISGTTEFILQNGTTESRKAASEIKLSNFNNDSGWTSCTGTVTSVGTTGTVNGITLTGTVTNSGTLTLGGTLGNITVSQLSAAAVQTSGEGFSDSDTVLMTAAAVDDRILSYGYTTNTGDITGVTAGTGLSGGGTSGGVTLAVDLSELTDMTAAMVGTDEFIVLDNGADRRKAANEIGLSIFSNDSGFTTCTGDITGVTAGVGLSGGGASGAVTLALDFSELTDMTGDISGTTEFILQNGTTESRKAASEIKLSNFNNDSGWTTCTGTVTSVAVSAGNGLTGGGTITTSGTATLNVGAGTGIDVAADTISVDVSDFMTNGSNNRVVTATGTDAMNAEANLTFDGSTLTVTGDAVVTGTLTAQDFKTELVSASIIFQSGSTIFGNSADDTHQFTGSVLIDGALEATTKSFVIDNPVKGGKLQYGVLEGPEHSVFYRGKATDTVIELPEEWQWLVDYDTITVQLTPIRSFAIHSFNYIKDNKIFIESQNGKVNCYFLVHAERKDVEKLKVNV